MPHLYRVLVPVSDIEEAARFYEDILSVPGIRVSPGRHYFDCEGTILACFDPRADGDGRSASPNPEAIYISVLDIEETYRLAKTLGARFATGSPPAVGPLGEIAKRPWGETSFYVFDPFDNEICFVAQDSVFRG